METARVNKIRSVEREAMPHNELAEKAVLGAVLLFSDLAPKMSYLAPEEFYIEKHQLIAELIYEELEKDVEDRHIDAITVLQLAKKRGVEEKIGGMMYLADLCENVPASAHIAHYSRIIRVHALRRKLIEVIDRQRGQLITQQDLDQITGELLEAVRYVQAEAQVEDESTAAGIEKFLLDMQTAYDSKTTLIPRRKFGIPALDDALMASEGHLIVLAARPGMGKTALALQAAINTPLEEGKTSIIFSMEMKRDELIRRIISQLSQVSATKLKNPWLIKTEGTNSEFMRIQQAIHTFRAIADKLIIIDKTAMTPGKIRAKVSEHRDNLGLVVIDYITLMEADRPSENSQQDVGKNSASLRNLAKEENVPILLLSQLNRKLESRPNKRPIASDLRDSGNIEQDANSILFIYRDDRYNPDTPDKGIAELIIEKQRDGDVGTVRVGFRGECTSFYDLDEFR